MKDKFSAFHKAETNFFSRVCNEQVNYDNLTAFATGVQASSLNPAIVTKIDAQFSENINLCQNFYGQRKLPWTLVIPDYLHTATTNNLLPKQAFILTGKGVAMAVDLEKMTFLANSSPLIIKLMADDLQQWSIPLIDAFESTSEVTGVYTARHEIASQSTEKLLHFSGFINEMIVCSLTLSLCGNTARLDDVATLPTYQKKGYATQLIYAALVHAQRLTITHCFLEASDSGLGLYQRMGFESLFRNHYYELDVITSEE